MWFFTKVFVLFSAFSLGAHSAYGFEGKYSRDFEPSTKSVIEFLDGNITEVSVFYNGVLQSNQSYSFATETTSDGELIHVFYEAVTGTFLLDDSGNEICAFPRHSLYDYCWIKE